MTPAKSSWQERYVQRYYRSRPGWIDGTAEFHAFIRQHINPAGEILELGPGPGGTTTRFLHDMYGRVDGLDIDPEAGRNPCLRQLYHCDAGTRWPMDNASYDSVVADYVLEHIERPRKMLGEIARVLRPNGVFLFRTPNIWHYTSLVSRLTPHGIHRLVSQRLRNLGPDDHDPYPTFYRLNTRASVLSFCRDVGLQIEELRLIEKEPSYGMSARPLFLVMLLYERLVNGLRSLSGLRANILGAVRRPGALHSTTTAS
jgi:SAM-dependent methyltransferase